MAEVLAAEQRAWEILSARKAHMKALAELLVKHGTVAGATLDEVLGKPANPIPTPLARAPDETHADQSDDPRVTAL
jgi:hypothetical protein